MRTMLLVGFSLLAGVVGCGNSGSGAAPGSGAAAPGGAKTSLTQAQLDDAFKLTDPDHYDKSLAAATAKLGPPQKTEPDTSIWYGVSKDGTMCYQLKLTKAKGNESGTVDKANCGLK